MHGGVQLAHAPLSVVYRRALPGSSTASMMCSSACRRRGWGWLLSSSDGGMDGSSSGGRGPMTRARAKRSSPRRCGCHTTPHIKHPHTKLGWQLRRVAIHKHSTHLACINVLHSDGGCCSAQAGQGVGAPGHTGCAQCLTRRQGGHGGRAHQVVRVQVAAKDDLCGQGGGWAECVCLSAMSGDRRRAPGAVTRTPCSTSPTAPPCASPIR